VETAQSGRASGGLSLGRRCICKGRLEKEKAALLVVIGALLDGRKVILAVEPGYRESTESWSEVLRDLKGRGLNCPSLVVGDGNLGI
jgi:transposase-like protein